MENTSIPIIFGITGHRDLRLEDIELLKNSIHDILKAYKDKYQSTEIILLSALAEGADMLAAEVAIELSINLKIVLPYEEEAYLQSFNDQKDAVEQYNKIKKYALDDFKVLECEHSKNIEDCYQALGEYIADTSNILIALYDGVDTDKKGGTSAIVKYTTTGQEDNLFDPLDGNVVCIITTPRLSNPNVEKPYLINCKFLGMMDEETFHEMLKKLDELNRESGAEIAKRKESTLLAKYHKFFDEKANEHQPKFKKSMLGVLGLTWLAIFFLEMMHIFNGVVSYKPWAGHLINVYAIGIIAALFIYFFNMKRGKLQDNFIFSRAIGESTRVQNAWNNAGIKKPVSKYYLANQSNKFTWIRVALKNLFFLQENLSKKYNNKDFETFENWIDGQLDYFNTNLPKRQKSIHKIHKYEKPIFIIGVVSLILMFVVYLLETFHFINHGHFPYNWHALVLVSGLSLITAGFIAKYSKIEGYEEDLRNYQLMEPNFIKAKKLLAKENITPTFKKKVIFDLGKKALEENSNWVGLHDSRRAKPELE